MEFKRWDGGQALDYVLSEASLAGIRLILALVNNWGDYGGKAQYVKWAQNAGCVLNSEDAFFTDSTVKGYYKSHVKKVLTRINTITGVAYKDDRTIFSWQLMNEPQCSSDPSGDTLQAWLEEMAPYVKSIDGNHLLAIGSEGFYGPSNPTRIYANPNSSAHQVGTDFLRHHQVAGIDFAEAHGYPDSWLGSSATVLQHISFLQNWLVAHIADCTSTLQMPFLFGEFGVSDRVPGYKRENRESILSMTYTILYLSALSGGAGGGCLLWQLFPEGLENFNDGYQIVLSKDPNISGIITNHSQRLQDLAAANGAKREGTCPIKFPWWLLQCP